MSDIQTKAQQLRADIRERRHGFDRDLIGFAQRFALSYDTKKEIILEARRLAAQDVGDAENNTHALDLVDRVVKEYSEQLYRKSRMELMQKDIEIRSGYIKCRSLTFRCSGLTKHFKTGFTLGEIRLELRKGDITAVVGENGNGKTTFFRIVAGDLKHDQGLIAYPFLGQSSERRIDWGLVKSRIAYVPQELPAWPGNLRHQLQYQAAIHGIRGDANLSQVEYVIQRMGLEDHLNKKWKELSGGFKLRFALAAALVWQPDMMILDEPLANLDVNAQLSMLRDIKNLASSVSHPIAVFISSQHLHEIEAIADHLLFLRDGKAVFNDSIKLLGLDREVNTYEVVAEIGQRDFIDLFPESMPVSIKHDGLHFIVSTPEEITATSILKIFVENDVEVRYFRDISRSSKNYFRRAT